jgi:hypothetical protein
MQVMAQDLAQSALDFVSPGGFADMTADSDCKATDRRCLLGLSVNEQNH